MDYGIRELKKVLKEFTKMSTEDYNILYNKMEQELCEHIYGLEDEGYVSGLWEITDKTYLDKFDEECIYKLYKYCPKCGVKL